MVLQGSPLLPVLGERCCPLSPKMLGVPLLLCAQGCRTLSMNYCAGLGGNTTSPLYSLSLSFLSTGDLSPLQRIPCCFHNEIAMSLHPPSNLSRASVWEQEKKKKLASFQEMKCFQFNRTLSLALHVFWVFVADRIFKI